MKIWGRNNSRNVKKVLWAAEEAGIEYEWINAEGNYLKQSEYLQKNPNGLIPVIEDGDFMLWESNTIVRYIAAKYSPGVLYLEDIQARAAGDKWLDWCSTSFFSHFKDVYWNVVRYASENPDWAFINDAIVRCETQLAIVESVLAHQPYLSGQEFGIGDIALGCYIYAWFEMPIKRNIEFPNTFAWYERLKTRPAYQKIVMTALT